MNIAVEMPHDVSGQEFKLSVGGGLRSAEATFDVFNPATGAVLARAPEGTRQDLDDAVAAAKAAFRTWSRLSPAERGAIITRFAEAIEAREDELATLLTLEQGKPRRTMAIGEVEASIFWVKEMAKARLPAEVIEDTPEHTVVVQHTPLGVAGAITPWNFPVLLGLWKIAPCLVTGNTTAMKPSPYTPLRTL